MASDEKRSAVDTCIDMLSFNDNDLVRAAREELRALRAENAAMRDELLRLRAIVCDADSESIDELIATTPTADIEQRRINAAEATRLLGLDQEAS